MNPIKQRYLYITLCLIIPFYACVNEAKRTNSVDKTNTISIANDEKSQESKDKIIQIKKIFYTLPSPLELTYLFKKEGVEYHYDKLHNTKNRNRYNLKIKKALNLGIYGADLSYAGLFGKHQDAIEYFTVTQLMAEDLGIGQTFQKEFVSRLEKNANSKDTLLQVVSEFFLDNDSYLKNQNQQDISTYILTGGWVEGLYLGTEMADEQKNSIGIREIIASQRYSLKNLILLIESLNNKDGSEELLQSIKKIDAHFDVLGDDDTEYHQTAKKENGVLKISSDKEEVILPDSTFNMIKEEVAAMRAKIIE